jgi:hypothetical protein
VVPRPSRLFPLAFASCLRSILFVLLTQRHILEAMAARNFPSRRDQRTYVQLRQRMHADLWSRVAAAAAPGDGRDPSRDVRLASRDVRLASRDVRLASRDVRLASRDVRGGHDDGQPFLRLPPRTARSFSSSISPSRPFSSPAPSPRGGAAQQGLLVTRSNDSFLAKDPRSRAAHSSCPGVRSARADGSSEPASAEGGLTLVGISPARMPASSPTLAQDSPPNRAVVESGAAITCTHGSSPAERPASEVGQVSTESQRLIPLFPWSAAPHPNKPAQEARASVGTHPHGVVPVSGNPPTRDRPAARVPCSISLELPSSSSRATGPKRTAETSARESDLDVASSGGSPALRSAASAAGSSGEDAYGRRGSRGPLVSPFASAHSASTPGRTPGGIPGRIPGGIPGRIPGRVPGRAAPSRHGNACLALGGGLLHAATPQVVGEWNEEGVWGPLAWVLAALLLAIGI